MTQEQKAKAYDKALEKAKYLHEAAANGGYDIDVKTFECLFPELKESEDERTRKELLEFLEELSKLGKNTNFDRWSKSDCADWICWLEKQGEQKPADNMVEVLRTEYEKGRADAIAEMQKPVDCTDCTNSKGCINCENGNMKETLVQKPAWSEEDEHRINDIIYFLETAKKHYASTVELDACIDWLKSLRPQNRWKPSDEQMDVLLSEVNAWTKGCPKQKVLESLYQDLKKLKS